MEIKEPKDPLTDVSYNTSAFKEVLSRIKDSLNTQSHHLCLFLGLYRPDKQNALRKLSEATGREVRTLDFNDIVSKSEEDTFRNLDRVFEEQAGSGELLYFENGDKLCGAYTGFTHSRVKYATPQERYFLNKVREHACVIVVDITEFTAADKTIRRAAQSIVKFVLPKSKLRRFFWHLKNYSLHGFELKSKRPESYGEFTGNV